MSSSQVHLPTETASAANGQTDVVASATVGGNSVSLPTASETIMILDEAEIQVSESSSNEIRKADVDGTILRGICLRQPLDLAREQTQHVCDAFPNADFAQCFRRLASCFDIGAEMQQIVNEFNSMGQLVEGHGKSQNGDTDVTDELPPKRCKFSPSPDGRISSTATRLSPSIKASDSLNGDILWIQVQYLRDKFPDMDPNVWYMRLEQATDVVAETEKIIKELEAPQPDNEKPSDDGSLPFETVVESILEDGDIEGNHPIDKVIAMAKNITGMFPGASFEVCFRRLMRSYDLDFEAQLIANEFGLSEETRSSGSNDNQAGPSNSAGSSGIESSNRVHEFLDKDQRQAMDTVLQMFPDCDPCFVVKQIAELNLRADVIVEKLMSGSYPKLKDRVAKEKQERRRQELLDPKKFDVEGFLKTFPEPETFFTDTRRTVAELYRLHALSQLQNDFPNIDTTYLTARLEDNSNHYLPALRALKEDIANMPPVGYGRKKKSGQKKPMYLQHLRQEPIPFPDQVDELFFCELQYSVNFDVINDCLKKKADRRKHRVEEARHSNLLSECPCCFSDDVLPDELIVCGNTSTPHRYCKDCIQRHANEVIAQGRHQVSCLSDDCKEDLPFGVLRHILQPRLIDLILRRCQQEDIRNAGIDNMESCPFCDFAVIMDVTADDDRVFRCQNSECLKQSCRLCKEPNHVPLKCDEVERADETAMRTFIENRIAEALIRTCPKCGKRIIKEEGCNKMICPCGVYLCYVCRQPLDKRDPYAHFNGKKGKGCPLHTALNEVHSNVAKKAGEQARDEYLNKHPELRDQAKKAVDVEKLVDGEFTKGTPRIGVNQFRQAMDANRMQIEIEMLRARQQMLLARTTFRQTARKSIPDNVREDSPVEAQRVPQRNIQDGGIIQIEMMGEMQRQRVLEEVNRHRQIARKSIPDNALEGCPVEAQPVLQRNIQDDHISKQWPRLEPSTIRIPFSPIDISHGVPGSNESIDRRHGVSEPNEPTPASNSNGRAAYVKSEIVTLRKTFRQLNNHLQHIQRQSLLDNKRAIGSDIRDTLTARDVICRRLFAAEEKALAMGIKKEEIEADEDIEEDMHLTQEDIDESIIEATRVIEEKRVRETKNSSSMIKKNEIIERAFTCLTYYLHIASQNQISTADLWKIITEIRPTVLNSVRELEPTNVLLRQLDTFFGDLENMEKHFNGPHVEAGTVHSSWQVNSTRAVRRNLQALENELRRLLDTIRQGSQASVQRVIERDERFDLMRLRMRLGQIPYWRRTSEDPKLTETQSHKVDDQDTYPKDTSQANSQSPWGIYMQAGMEKPTIIVKDKETYKNHMPKRLFADTTVEERHFRPTAVIRQQIKQVERNIQQLQRRRGLLLQEYEASAEQERARFGQGRAAPSSRRETASAILEDPGRHVDTVAPKMEQETIQIGNGEDPLRNRIQALMLEIRRSDAVDMASRIAGVWTPPARRLMDIRHRLCRLLAELCDNTGDRMCNELRRREILDMVEHYENEVATENEHFRLTGNAETQQPWIGLEESTQMRRRNINSVDVSEDDVINLTDDDVINLVDSPDSSVIEVDNEPGKETRIRSHASLMVSVKPKNPKIEKYADPPSTPGQQTSPDFGPTTPIYHHDEEIALPNQQNFVQINVNVQSAFEFHLRTPIGGTNDAQEQLRNQDSDGAEEGIFF